MHKHSADRVIFRHKRTQEFLGNDLPDPGLITSMRQLIKLMRTGILALVLALLVPLAASAQICPIQNSGDLPKQPGHPWTELASCVSGVDAVVGGMVGNADCTNVYIGEKQGFHEIGALGTITIQGGGTLVFLDRTYSMEVGSIIVQSQGTLQIGAETCPISTKNQIRVFFTGGKGIPKGIDVKSGATLRMWGHRGNTAFSKVSWTHLAEPAGPSKFDAAHNVASPVPAANPADTIVVNNALGWNTGDWIVIAGTNYSPDSAEIVQIQSILPNSPTGKFTITLNQPLIDYHFGGPSPTCDKGDPYCGPSPTNFNDGKQKNYGLDERAEVGLLSRSIHLTSITPNPYQQDGSNWEYNPPPTGAGLHWGAEIEVESGFAAAEISGVEIEKGGGDQNGQFPIYFTGPGSQAPIISSDSIHHSYNKCIALNGLNTPTTINDNVCARIVGDMFYLQTGAEQNLSFIHNLGVGAMSNGFMPNPNQATPPAPPLYELWWAGDNLTNQPAANCPQPGPGTDGGYNCYDGFNITLTDDISLPAVQTAAYESSGFWITNPANYFEANSIAGCQDQGIGFWYNLTQANATVPLGIGQQNGGLGFHNNRAHGCYYGLNTPPQLSNGALYTPQKDSLDLIAKFDGVIATRNRNVGIWARAAWYSFTNARLGGNLEGASLASAGGTEGSPPGEWSQITGATFVGSTMNNPERFGPCPYNTFGVIVGSNPTPPGPYCAEIPLGANATALGVGFPGPKRNEIGYMFYDGPARVENSRFVNYKVNISPLLTTQDAKFLTTYSTPTSYWNPTMPCDINTPFVYEGDTAIGWFQSNVNSYPPTQYTEKISFQHVDLRHEVYTQEVGVTCASSTTVDFQDGDKNTVILDHDDSLSGYQVVNSQGQPVWGKFPISLNNLPFLAVADTTNNVKNTVDECYAQGGQDTVYEDRPTAQMSPNDYATLEFSAVPCPLLDGSFSSCTNSNVITFGKDQQDYGVHQTMSLNGRNGNGIYEPKVMNGLGYTVQAQYEMPPNINVTYTDASAHPFEARLGICYTTPSGPIQCPGNDCSSVFTVSKGVKTLGEPGTTILSALAPYFTDYTVCNGLDNQYGYPDSYNLPNLALCPDPSLDTSKTDVIPPPPTPITQVSSLSALTPSTYFYDQNTGLLFLDVEQEKSNGDSSLNGGNGGGPSPLGDCGGANPDPACPAYSFYSCPSGGCELYMVQVNPSAYAYDPTSTGTACNPYPTYNQDYPPNLNMLENMVTNTVLTPDKISEIDKEGFPHLIDASGAACPTPTPSM